MLNAIIRFSVRNKLIIGLFTLALIVLGTIDLKNLPIDALPDITSNQVQIITVSPSLAAPEVERLITFPLEQANSNIPGLIEMRSISRFGLSVITVVFNDETDTYWARQQVSERLSLVRDQIPASAGNPELAPVTTGLGEIYQYVLKPQKGYEGKYDLTELRSIQDWIVRRQLLGTPGVADVSSFGGYLKQYEIAVQPDHLKSMNVTLTEVFNALEKNNQNSGGSYIEKGPEALFIRTEGLAATPADLEKIFVKHTDAGIPIFIKDVAEVRIGHAIRYGAMTYKNQGEVAGAVVLMLKGANASQVVEHVKAKIEQIKKTLPEGVDLEPFYDRTKMVDNAIHTVKTNLLEGALIVILVLVLFLGNLRAGFIVASVIPLSMLFAITMMNLFGVSGNLMSLGALDFGLIVDGAVIIVEAVLHRLHYGKQFAAAKRITQRELDEEVGSSASKMMNAAVFGQIIILIVYLPILTLTGIEGKMFRPMAQTVSFALIGAFLLSFTYVPMMSALFLSKNISHKESLADKLMNSIQRIYSVVLKKALAFPKSVVSIAGLLFAGSLLILSQLGGEFIPRLEEGDFAVDARLLTGSSLTETVKQTQKAAALLQNRFPEIEKIVTRIGASEIPTDPMPLEMTDIMITLKPKKEWSSASSFDELANKMSKALDEIPGMAHGFQYPVQMRFNELISGARQDVVCKIFGDDLDSLSTYANALGGIVATVQGAKDIYVETVTGLPQVVIRYNRESIARFQLNISEINRMVQAAFAGETAGIIYENERRYDLVVRLDNADRKDLSDVQQLLIPTPSGLQIPLYQVASVEIREGPNQIQRENAQRRIIVGFNVRGRDVESVVNELNNKTAGLLKLPPGYYIKYGGQFENLTEATNRLSIAVPLALLLILTMLYFAFGSLKYGLLIFSAIPLSAIGGIMALWIRGMPFSISAGVGFIALFGVVVLNGIVLITEFNRLKKSGMEDINQIIHEGTRIRLRPVLMTASVASLGFIPMALSQSSGAEVQRPLATVVIGGLVTATILTLVVLPILYRWFERGRTKKPKNITVAGIVMFCLLSGSLQAQQKMKLEDMLKMGSAQNLNLQAIKKETGYWQQLQSRIFDPGKTAFGGEYGGINGLDNDTRFFVSQGFSLPVVYNRQRQLYKAEQHLREELANWKDAELHKAIRLNFYSLVDNAERQKLLQSLDSIYSRFQQSANLRFQTGETNILEKTTAEAQLQQIKLQQAQLNADLLLLQQQLQWLLQSGSLLLPDYSSLKAERNALPDSTDIDAHPQIRYNEMQTMVARAQTGIEKAKLTPDFSIGYSNQSIIGYHSEDGVNQKYYDGGHRFHIASLTMGIPLFNGAARARIKAGKIQEEVADLNLKASIEQMKNSLSQLETIINKEQLNLDYYENTGLEQSALIMRSAALSFEKGEISYVEWVTLMNNAINIRINYLDAVQQYNQAVIEFNYLNRK